MRAHGFAAVVMSGIVAGGSALALSGCGSSGGSGGSSSSSTTTGTTSPAKLTVMPLQGKRATSFTFTFTPPGTAGRQGQTNLAYQLGVRGPAQAGCLTARAAPIPQATAGRQVSVTLDPARLGGLWCQGDYVARVSELQTPVCTPGEMCPQFIRVAIVATGSFRVTGP
jgi:hypothetical protein